MKAIVLNGPNDFRLEEREVPKPGRGEVLCRVKACAICGSDPKVIAGKWRWTKYPMVPGHEWTGVVEEIGEGVDELSPGDRVSVEPHKGCGTCFQCATGNYTLCENYGRPEKGHMHIGFTADGGYAEYCKAPIQCLHSMPQGISFEEGTIITTAGTSLYALERVELYAGDSVAVYGPGPIGIMAAQIAKALGAGEVIVVGTRESRLEMAKALGADHVINSKAEDPVKEVLELTDGRGVDVGVEASGAPLAAKQLLESVRKNGRMALIGFFSEEVSLNLNRAVVDGIRIVGSRAEGMRACARATDLLARGLIKGRPLITHQFPLSEFPRALETAVKRLGDAMKVVVKP